jgi:uncharacterized membrane protein
MENTSPKGKSSIFLATHLLIYQITFALFVIYYIQQGMLWFKISWIAIVVSALTAFARIISGYKLNRLTGDNKKIFIISLLGNFLFFALYIFCMLVQKNQWKVLGSPPLVVIPLLAVPLLIAFASFLYTDAREPDISNEDQQ